MKRFYCICFAALLFCGAFVLPVKAEEARSGEQWVASWACAPVEAEFHVGSRDISVSGKYTGARIRICNTVTGEQLRIRLSNQFGDAPLTVNACAVSRASGEYASGIQSGTSVPAAFSGLPQVTIPPGETVVSDPIPLSVSAGEYLAVDLYLRSFSGLKTVGTTGGDSFLTLGNPIGKARLDSAVSMRMVKFRVVPVLTGLEVSAKNTRVIALVGDSTIINDIPTKLAARIRTVTDEAVGVVGLGISGNRILSHSEDPLMGKLFGRPLLERVEEDALSLPGVTHLVVKCGANDILQPYLFSLQGKAAQVSAEQVIEGLKQVVALAERRNIAVMLLPITNWKGYTRDIFNTGKVDLVWSEEAQAKTDAVNRFISQYAKEQGYTYDFSVLTAPDDPLMLNTQYSDDLIHYNALGECAFVNAIPLYFFGYQHSELVPMEPLLIPQLHQPPHTTRTLVLLGTAALLTALLLLTLLILLLRFIVRKAKRKSRKVKPAEQ